MTFRKVVSRKMLLEKALPRGMRLSSGRGGKKPPLPSQTKEYLLTEKKRKIEPRLSSRQTGCRARRPLRMGEWSSDQARSRRSD